MKIRANEVFLYFQPLTLRNFLQANEKQLAENVVRTFYLKFDNSATLLFEKNCLKVTKHGERTVNSLLVFVFMNITSPS